MKTLGTTTKDEELGFILRGNRGGTAHPVAKITFVDDDGSDVDITSDLINMEITLKRDDRRTDIGLLVPPAATLRATFANEDKKFTPGAGGGFDGKLSYGRVMKPRIGFKVFGADEFLTQGEFLLDEPSFNVIPGATASIVARDKLSLALEQNTSLAANASSILAQEYIREILLKVGLVAADIDIPAGTATTSFGTTPARTNEKSIELLSEALTILQKEGPFRLVQIEGKLKLVKVPVSGLAGFVFHYKRDLSKSFSRRERSNQARLRTTTKTVDSPSIAADITMATGSGDRSDLPKTITFASGTNVAIRVEWRQGGVVVLKETARTPGNASTAGTLTIADAGSGDAGDAWSITIKGDRLASASEVIGEAGSGEDQSGTGLGNTNDMLALRRGRTTETKNRLLENQADAQSLADILQTRFGDPAREISFGVIHAFVLGEVNDLIRIVEKYSNDLRLYHIGEISHRYDARQPLLSTKMVGQFANITEIDQQYDKGFKYDQGRIYDEDVAIGEEDKEDTSFRGAVVARTRP